MAPLQLVGLSVKFCCFLAPFVEGSQVFPISGNTVLDDRGIPISAGFGLVRDQ
jgi:hypothetical protein